LNKHITESIHSLPTDSNMAPDDKSVAGRAYTPPRDLLRDIGSCFNTIAIQLLLFLTFDFLASNPGKLSLGAREKEIMLSEPFLKLFGRFVLLYILRFGWGYYCYDIKLEGLLTRKEGWAVALVHHIRDRPYIHIVGGLYAALIFPIKYIHDLRNTKTEIRIDEWTVFTAGAFAYYLRSPHYCPWGPFLRRFIICLSTLSVALVFYAGTMLPFRRSTESPEYDATFAVTFGMLAIVFSTDPAALAWYWRMGELARRIRGECKDTEDGQRQIEAKETLSLWVGELLWASYNAELPTNERLTNERLTNERLTNERLTNERPTNEKPTNEKRMDNMVH
jgi:hypothetical protein